MCAHTQVSCCTQVSCYETRVAKESSSTSDKLSTTRRWPAVKTKENVDVRLASRRWRSMVAMALGVDLDAARDFRAIRRGICSALEMLARQIGPTVFFFFFPLSGNRIRHNTCWLIFVQNVICYVN